jgi:hypothetical protein
MWRSVLWRRIDKFNRAAVNHALEPIERAVPRNIEAGHALVRFGDERVNEAYDRALINVSFSATAWAKFELKPQEMESEGLLSADEARRLGAIIKNRLDSHFDAGVMDGQAFKAAESELSDAAWRYRPLYLGKVLDGVVSTMQTSLCEQNPARADALRRAIEARTRFDVIVAAACGVTAEGRFTPKDILCAALQKDREGYRRGKAPMQDWVRSRNWGGAVLREGPYNDDARLAELVKELAARLMAWDAEQ